MSLYTHSGETEIIVSKTTGLSFICSNELSVYSSLLCTLSLRHCTCIVTRMHCISLVVIKLYVVCVACFSVTAVDIAFYLMK